MHFHIITLFPEAFDSYFKASIIGRAIKEGNIKVSFYNPRDFSRDSHKRVDRKPYGGGPGMVMEAEPVLRAVEKAIGKKKGVKGLFFTPSGKQFSNTYADSLTKYKHVVLLSGRYEGIDARVRKILKAEEISVGPYTLTGGELPAMAVVDAVARRIPGVLGDELSVEERRVAGKDVYTRPEVLTWKRKKYKVPEVLTSGHHKEIEKWKARKKR
ncbi:MAG: tRNA (guanosine(37)-N1)-methyltransferase TrmD [Candidatus Paceibacterota bacterium]